MKIRFYNLYEDDELVQLDVTEVANIQHDTNYIEVYTNDERSFVTDVVSFVE